MSVVCATRVRPFANNEVDFGAAVTGFSGTGDLDLDVPA
jgi:hypothetical protein